MKKVLVIALILSLLVTTVGFDGVIFEADAAIGSVDLYIRISEGVESIGICSGSPYDASKATIYTSSGTFPARAGFTYSWYATAKPGYTIVNEAGTIVPQSGVYNELSVSVKKEVATYPLTVTINTGIARVVLTFGDGSVRYISTTSTLNIDEGMSVSWTATPAIGYNLSNGSGSFTMTTARTITPVANAKFFTVIATCTPTDAEPDLTWTLEWASGKALTGAVTDYVTMTVSTDKKSVTLTFKKAFTNGQMILTCYATNNPSVSATCTITCG